MWYILICTIAAAVIDERLKLLRNLLTSKPKDWGERSKVCHGIVLSSRVWSAHLCFATCTGIGISMYRSSWFHFNIIFHFKDLVSSAVTSYTAFLVVHDKWCEYYWSMKDDIEFSTFNWIQWVQFSTKSTSSDNHPAPIFLSECSLVHQYGLSLFSYVWHHHMKRSFCWKSAI